MRRKMIIGNWKMNGSSASMAEALAIEAAASACPAVNVAICPPFTMIAAVASACPAITIGGQDCHSAASGAYTGSTSASMLHDAGATLVILGHSERRVGLGETNAMVKAKVEAALAVGLFVILCVGEALDVREDGEAVAFVVGQVRESLPDESPSRGAGLAIAYEPIWAIGTGRTAELEDIARMHGAIRGALGNEGTHIPILYGGSVTADNAASILALDQVDGALVGGASLSAAKFAPIIAAAG